VLPALAVAYEAERPGVRVSFSFGASSELATQIVEGAPADVFAAASESIMDVVVEEGLAVGTPTIFATNTLEIAVPAGNPGDVAGIKDLAEDDLVVALCASQVPCGAAADRLLDLVDVPVKPDTREEDVRAALTRVQLGEVDAALVYRTDVLAAGDTVEGIAIPAAGQVVNRYPAVALADAGQADLAQELVEFLRSAEAADVLRDAGFGVP
jgi:molybdate transport system substrate-binding protein